MYLVGWVNGMMLVHEGLAEELSGYGNVYNATSFQFHMSYHFKMNIRPIGSLLCPRQMNIHLLLKLFYFKRKVWADMEKCANLQTMFV